MPRRILFNALVASPEGAGVSRYAWELGRELLAMRDDVVLTVQRSMAERFTAPPERLLIFPDTPSSWRRILKEQFVMAGRARDFALAHFPDFVRPLSCPWPLVVTCHDLALLRMPEVFTSAQRIWKRRAARNAVRADRILCVSRHTAGDLAEFLHPPPERVRVIHSGVRAYAGPAIAPDAALPERFILCVGTLEPRKNIPRLLQALALMRRQGSPLHLVLAGNPGWKYGEVFETIRRLNLADLVVFAGHCDDARLKHLYQRAVLLAYVSLYEGFGFPPLEAMTCGLPVVAAHVSSLPEICGDAAEYVDPLSAEDIARGIHAVLDDPRRRDQLASLGRARSRLFTWRRTAAEVSAVYDELLNCPSL